MNCKECDADLKDWVCEVSYVKLYRRTTVKGIDDVLNDDNTLVIEYHWDDVDDEVDYVKVLGYECKGCGTPLSIEDVIEVYGDPRKDDVK